MHPDLKKIADLLNSIDGDLYLVLRFGLKCVEEVAGNLENDDVIAVLNEFRRCLNDFGPTTEEEVKGLAVTISKLAASHPGSRSIDGTRHAAVSATYALARAVNRNAIDAAAYAAYSCVYGYGGYAVSDPEAFAEVHHRQLGYLRKLMDKTRRSELSSMP
jgi:hypothetical protein